MKKLLSIFLSVSMILALSACDTGTQSTSGTSSQTDSGTVSDSKTSETTPDTTPDTTPAETQKTGFEKYVSNTFLTSGNNHIVETAEGLSYRVYFPVEEYGSFEYCFYFSNTIDSTYDKKGRDAFVGKSGGEYTIESATIADGGTSPEDEITNIQTVTFDEGSKTKKVSPDEKFWSDPVTIDIPESHYLVWEWKLTGTDIPANNVSTLTKTLSAEKDDFKYCDIIPMPQLIGCDRDVKMTVSAIGDSITQGCQTEFMKYEFWAAQISQKLGKDYSFWNCGLGWSRSSDAAAKGDWLERAKTSDVVIVAFGTNDIISGEYGGDGGNTADEINAYIGTILKELKDAGCKIILFNSPPQDFSKKFEPVRTELNEKLKATAKEYGAELFDFAGLLSNEEDPSKAIYGGHPNGEAGKLVAEEFVKQYSDLLGL